MKAENEEVKGDTLNAEGKSVGKVAAKQTAPVQAKTHPESKQDTVPQQKSSPMQPSDKRGKQ